MNLQDYGALGMVAAAMLVVCYLAFQGSEQAMGALISVVAAGVSFYLRGKVQRPGE